ncbi:MAG: hypothetical protein HKN29_05575, partial [Rhodothermales bacterium]|nr:hypothetical protein [Rhodothermales bacterium]
MSQDTSVIAPPPPEAIEAAEQLHSGCGLLCDEARSLADTWAAAVSKKVVEPLSAKLAEMEARHQSEVHVLRERLENLGEEDQEDQRWRAAEAYVRHVHANCIEPLLAYLEEADPIAALEDRFVWASKQLMAAAEELPETTEVPFSEVLVEKRPDDSLKVRTAKTWQRRRRSSRIAARRLGNSLSGLWGKEAIELPYEGRVVPARSVAQARLSVDVLPRLQTAQQPLVAAMELRLRELERSIWRWTQEGLRFLTDQDHPRYHVPESLTLKWPRSPNPEPADLEPPSFMELLQFEPGAFPALESPDLTEALARVEHDLEVAGTFLYGGLPTTPIGSTRPPVDAAYTRDRIRLADGLLDLWRDMRKVEEGLLMEVAHQTFVPLERTYASIQDHIRKIETDALALVGNDAPSGKRKSRALHKALEELLDTSAGIDALYRDLSGLTAADKALTDPGESTWKNLMKRVAALPQDLTLRGSVGEHPRTMRVNLRQVVRHAFERPIPERLKSSADPLRRTIARVWNQTEQVREVVANTFHTALQQLSAEETSEELAGEDDGDLRELISSGLERARNSLDERYQSIGPDWAHFVSQLHRILTDDWNSAFRALQSDDFLAKRLLGVQTLVARRAERSWKGFTEWSGSAMESGRATLRLLRMRARDLIRIGQTAVGVGAATREERHQALDTVSSARALYAQLP